ncbi:hypothetical protein PTKIN_Ptkin01aG0350800 [Pterospermum kingtungense]
MSQVDENLTYFDACGEEIGYGHYQYHCPKCNFQIHCLCATIHPSVKYDIHQQSLSYFRSKSKFVRCYACDEQTFTKYDPSAFYRSGNFNFHLRCVPIPSITKHGYHRHALELITLDSFLEDTSDEYYCDVCEEERNQKHPIYYSRECEFVAHVPCAINKVDNKSLMPKLIEQGVTEEEKAESDQSQLEVGEH